MVGCANFYKLIINKLCPLRSKIISTIAEQLHIHVTWGSLHGNVTWFRLVDCSTRNTKPVDEHHSILLKVPPVDNVRQDKQLLPGGTIIE